MSCPAGGTTRGAPVALELADILRKHPPDPAHLSPRQKQAVWSITHCRTAALGWRIETCDQCGHRVIDYHSCRDRHCPKCQGVNQARWVEARLEDLLPVGYHHVVFTIHQALHPFFRADPTTAYAHLFGAVSETLLEVAANPSRLGARIGIIAMLHTWNQKLGFHPHIHCVVPAGGLSSDGNAWTPAKSGYFLPVKILSQVFRGKLLSRLEREIKRPDSRVHPEEGRPLLKKAARSPWVVYSKAPFTTPDRVLKYLGRYTHRIALSNRRLVSLQDGKVTYRYQDRKDRGRPKLETVEAQDFVKRFLQHVLPKGFVRIRYYGILANAVRRENVDRCRTLLHSRQDNASAAAPPTAAHEGLPPEKGSRCPRCGRGTLVFTEQVLAQLKSYLGPGPPECLGAQS